MGTRCYWEDSGMFAYQKLNEKKRKKEDPGEVPVPLVTSLIVDYTVCVLTKALWRTGQSKEVKMDFSHLLTVYWLGGHTCNCNKAS